MRREMRIENMRINGHQYEIKAEEDAQFEVFFTCQAVWLIRE
jgi:hypothetical protein